MSLPEEGPKKKRSRKDPKRAIPAPTPTEIPLSLRARKGDVRSEAKLRVKEVDGAKRRAQHFMEWAQVIRVPTTLEKLKETAVDMEELDQICSVDLGSNKPAQCLSARFVGEDGETLLLYFGRRIVTKDATPPVCFILTTYRPHLTSIFSRNLLI